LKVFAKVIKALSKEAWTW